MDAKTLINRINEKNKDNIKAISINGDIATCQCLKCNKMFETKVPNVLCELPTN